MELGYIGLGKMGYSMVQRLLEKGNRVVAYNRSPQSVQRIGREGAVPAASFRGLAAALKPPRLVWLMLPHGSVDAVLGELTALLRRGDVVIDGGNSPYPDSQRRARELEAQGFEFLDAGVSGGPAGARSGACIMVGGKQDIFLRYEPLFRDLAAENAYGYFGQSGAGHFVKMVHNGIEYGMMQALAEGFAVMKAGEFNLDLRKVAELYNRRSVIESRLVGWLAQAYAQHGQDLTGISGSAAESGEGRWTVKAAKELDVPSPVIETALNFRHESQTNPSYIGKILSALRNQFGGHEVKE